MAMLPLPSLAFDDWLGRMHLNSQDFSMDDLLPGGVNVPATTTEATFDGSAGRTLPQQGALQVGSFVGLMHHNLPRVYYAWVGNIKLSCHFVICWLSP